MEYVVDSKKVQPMIFYLDRFLQRRGVPKNGVIREAHELSMSWLLIWWAKEFACHNIDYHTFSHTVTNRFIG